MRVTTPGERDPIRIVCPNSCPSKIRGAAKHEGAQKYRAVLTTGRHPNGKRRQETTTHDTLAKAKAHVVRTRAALESGTYTAKDRTTVDGLCTLWLASKRDVRAVTANAYASVLKSVRARLGSMAVQDVRRSHVEGFVTWLHTEGGQSGTGVSRRTTSLTLGTLKMVFEYAVAEGLIPSSPVATVKAPRRRPEDERAIAVWSVGQLAAFVDHADTDDWAGLWRLTASGLRRSEVCGLRWSDIDLDAGTITVSQGRVAFGSKSIAVDAPKSRASARTVPVENMWPGTVALLRSLSTQQARDRLKAGEAWQDSGYVLVDALGQPVRPEGYSDRFRALSREAGVPVIRLHDVRHSVATLLHAAGAAPAHAASLLGHGLQVHLNTYVTPSQEGVTAAGLAFSQALSAAR